MPGRLNWSPLHKAILKRDLNKARTLLKKGEDIEIEDDEDWMTPLMVAADIGYLDGVKFLISNGANINSGNCDGYTPLLLAARNGYVKIIKYLIESGADINARDNHGMTTLQVAAEIGDAKTIRCLLEKEAEPQITGLITTKYLESQKYVDLLRLAKWFEIDLYSKKKENILDELKKKIDLRKGDLKRTVKKRSPWVHI